MKKILVVTLILSLTACAGTGAQYRPLVDNLVSPQYGANYENDVADCQKYADQRANAIQGLAVGAVLGALVGAAVSSGRGYQRSTMEFGAGLGGVSGAARANETQESIVKRCMAGRGYAVLN